MLPHRIVQTQLEHYRHSLDGWMEPDGMLVPTEPDPDERASIRHDLKVSIALLEWVLEQRDRVEVTPRPSVPKPPPEKLSRFWVGWVSTNEKPIYFGPWWGCGMAELGTGRVFVAAVMARTPVEAMDEIRNAYPHGDLDVTFRFVRLRPDDWSPFAERYPRAEWMEWPEPQPSGDAHV